MKKLPKIFLICSFVLGFYFQSFAFDGRDSIQSGPERDSSFSVKRITDIRQRFAQKGKYYLDYIQNQSTSAQDGSFRITGSGSFEKTNGDLALQAYRSDHNGGIQIFGTQLKWFNNLYQPAIEIKQNNYTNTLIDLGGGYISGGAIKVNLNNQHQSYGGGGIDVTGSWSAANIQNIGAKGLFADFNGWAGNYYGAYADVKIVSGGSGSAWAFYGANGKNYFKDNVLIGTTTDAGSFKLQVAGSAYLKGSTNKSAMIDAENGSISIYGTEGGPHSINIERTSTSINNFIRMYDNATLGEITIGGVSSNGFSPGIKMKPDGSVFNSSYIISQVNDIGTEAAIVLDARKFAGPLVNQPLLSVGSYINTKLKVMANGNVLIGNTTDAGYKLDVNGTGRFTNTVKVATASSGQDILQLTNASGNNVVVNQYGELLVGLAQRTGSSLLHVADGLVTFDRYAGGGTAAAFFDGAGNFYKSNLQWVNNELYWWDKSSQVANSYKLLLNYGYSNGDYALQVKGDIYNGTMANEINDPDRIVVNSGGVLRYMTRAQLGIGSSSTTNAWSLTGNSSTTPDQFIGTTSNNAQPLIFKTNGNEAFRVNSSGELSIGTPNSHGYKLAVNGNILTQKIKVTQAGWPDYVFDHNYKLPTLKEVEQYIKQNKHLPDAPSEKEVQQNGLDVGDNQAVLLKKIEELTLYIIQQDKKIELQERKIDDLETKNKELTEIRKDLEAIKAKLK